MTHFRKALWLAGFLALGCGSGGETQIRNLEPRVGALQGEQTVKITGANFRTDIGYTVYFGNRKAPTVTILDSETLAVTTPNRDAAGSVDVIVSADNGPAWRVKDAFRYEDLSGSVVEKLGDTSDGKGNLAY